MFSSFLITLIGKKVSNPQPKKKKNKRGDA